MRHTVNRAHYRLRYCKLMADLTNIEEMEPKEKYLYNLMDTVIFCDFETALDVVLEDFKQSDNDNWKYNK